MMIMMITIITIISLFNRAYNDDCDLMFTIIMMFMIMQPRLTSNDNVQYAKSDKKTKALPIV